MTDEDALYWNVLAIDRQRIGWNLPATRPEAVGEVVEGIAVGVEVAVGLNN